MLKHPDAQIISLGIGDTTEPIPEVITSAMAKVILISLSYYSFLLWVKTSKFTVFLCPILPDQ